MSRLSTSFRVVAVDRVVAQQLLGGLEARQRRRPLTRVLLAVEEHADLRCRPPLRIRSTFCWNGPALDVVVGQRDVGPRRCPWASPAGGSRTGSPSSAAGRSRCPTTPRYVIALTSALAAGFALIASITCAAVLDRSPVGVRAERDEDVRCRSTATISGEFAAPGSRSSAVMLLPPSWPHALDVRTTRARLPSCRRPCCRSRTRPRRTARRSRARASAAPSG